MRDRPTFGRNTMSKRPLGPPVYSIDVDNDALAREVAYITEISASLMAPSNVFDGPALHAYLVKHIAYQEDTDPLTQQLRLPWRTLSEGVADCKSSAILVGALALRAGRNVVLRYIDENAVGSWNHVYAVVDGVPIDPLEAYGQEIAHKIAHDEPLYMPR